jgi:hypothetical protein
LLFPLFQDVCQAFLGFVLSGKEPLLSPTGRKRPSHRSSRSEANIVLDRNGDRNNLNLPITELAVLFRGDPTPPGFVRISRTNSGSKADLNKSAGGKYVYLCYKRGHGPPLTATTVVFRDKGEFVPHGFEMLLRTPKGEIANLNSGSAGEVPRHCPIFVEHSCLNLLAGNIYLLQTWQWAPHSGA